MADSLFWYPAIHLNCNADFDKAEMLDSYVRYFLARLQSMFKYDGLPDTIPAKYLESYLLTNGNALIAKAPDGNLYAFTGGMGGYPNAYYVPSKYVVANPYLEFTETYNIKNEFQDGNAVLVYNDTYSQGLLPMLRRYCTQLVENDITLQLADILARATLAISAGDDKSYKSAELWLNRLKQGKLGIMGSNAFLSESLDIRNFKDVASTITPLIEYHQYIKASLFNELGLNSNYNMKRESINSNESQLNDDMLHPLIDDMLKERKEGIERVNELFGLNITVEFDNAWMMNEREEVATIEQIENEAEEVQPIEDDTKIYPGISSEDVVETSEEVETEEVETEEVEPDEAIEAETIEANNNAIVEAINELTDTVEEVVDVLSEENIEGDNDNEEVN